MGEGLVQSQKMGQISFDFSIREDTVKYWV